jgi:hypothetical protein
MHVTLFSKKGHYYPIRVANSHSDCNEHDVCEGGYIKCVGKFRCVPTYHTYAMSISVTASNMAQSFSQPVKNVRLKINAYKTKPQTLTFMMLHFVSLS